MPVEAVSNGQADCVDGRPQWLVSLRCETELRIAVDHPIDILDLKEPRRGPLAPSDRSLWETAVALVSRSNSLPPTGFREGTIGVLSAALGEHEEAIAVAKFLPPEFTFAKVGPSGCRSVDQLRSLWDRLRSSFSGTTELVAVAYADHVSAKCPEPADIFDAAAKSGMGRCLIDTFSKDGRSTFSHLSEDQLVAISDQARGLGLWWTLAGSIRHDDLSRIRSSKITPDCIGVRGDACDDGRGGTLSVDRLKLWQKSLEKLRPKQLEVPRSHRRV